MLMKSSKSFQWIRITRVKQPDYSRRVGLARALSKLGHCSRSQGFVLVRSGRVRLNGQIVKNPEVPVRLGNDRIQIDGNPVRAEAPVYLMMNKPRGIVTTASDEKGRETVYSHLPAKLPWVGPVGRLDKASEGLLLLTNDSEWGAKILAPETHLEKIYHAQIGTIGDERLMRSMMQGVRSDAGELLSAKKVRLLRTGNKNSWLEIFLEEGKNRQIRRLLEALDVEVLRLIRVQIGPLRLGSLPKGGVRRLTPEEKEGLDQTMRRSAKASLRTQRVPSQ
jgi:23S rRNA pseudouridine2605 synthase